MLFEQYQPAYSHTCGFIKKEITHDAGWPRLVSARVEELR